MNKKYSRREFLFKNIVGGAALAGGGWILASFKLAPTTSQNTLQPANQGTPAAGSQQTPKSGPAGQDAKPCEDLTGVAPGELEKRKKFAYVNVSPIPDSRCGNCKLFLPPGSGKACGGCMLFKGPVQESGYCTYWAPLE